MSAVHPLLHGIIESGSDRSERFELKSLHAAHPTLLTAVMDSQFKNLTQSRYSETEQEAVKTVIVKLMEMYKDQEEESDSPEPLVKHPKKFGQTSR